MRIRLQLKNDQEVLITSRQKQKPDVLERQLVIREQLKINQEVSIPDLAVMFNVSEMTIHRDLKKLEDNGRVRRTRGGAVAAERMEFEFDFAFRRKSHHSEKQAIARKALEFVKPGARLILDTGTTTLELALLLKDLEDITVITPSLAVASVLQFSSGVETVLLGGVIRHGSPDLTGIVTEANLDMFTADIAFQGADAIGLDGTLYTDDMRIVKVDQKIRKQAVKNYVLADSSKFGKTSLAVNGNVHQVDALITDDKISVEFKSFLKEKGTTLITVKV